MKPVDPQAPKAPDVRGSRMTRIYLRQIEYRQWWLWASAVVILLLLTFGLASFVLFLPYAQGEISYTWNLPQAVYGLLGLVLLFDIYVVYQQIQIHRMHRQANEQQEIFRLIGENAADMIAVVQA